MAEVETRTQKQAAGATEKLTEADVKGKLIEFAFWMNKEGYKESTIKLDVTMLRRLMKRGANPSDPESVKEVIAKCQEWSNGTKEIAARTYTRFLAKEGLTWRKPRYKRTDQLPFIPMEEEIDQLIASCGRKISVFLQGLKETGADPSEFARIRWIDINRETRTIAINYPVKGHNPRILKVSSNLIHRLEPLPKNGERVFTSNAYTMYSTFHYERKRAAKKLGNPRLLKISFTTLRHWKGTMEYHKTKDILHVKKLLGHKCIESTMVYINLEVAVFAEGKDEFTVRVAEKPQEIKQLLEVGFEYICEKDGLMFFRKRK